MSRPVCLIILDGFGLSPDTEGNPIRIAKMPVFDSFIRSYPVVALAAAEQNVGLSFGEMGNSEVGHIGLGSGQVIYQTLPRINMAIESKAFFENDALMKAITHVQKKKSRLHLVGLCSNGGIHAHIDHLHALLQLCKTKGVSDVAVHAILDGRDAKEDTGINFITTLQDILTSSGVGVIATLAGRYWSMDRDERWERIEVSYRAMVEGVAKKTATDALAAITNSYAAKIFDEQFEPTIIVGKDGKPVAQVTDGDAVIFFNFREDRARELTKAFVTKDFQGFTRTPPKILFVSMTEYEHGLPTEVAFPPIIITTPLARVIADAKLKQYHIAETEKYAHVTYFFNGGGEEPFKGEVRDLVPSPSVKSYDEKPEMSAARITDKLVQKIQANAFDFYLINYANPDMVGHTGNLEATVAGLEVVDACVGRVTDAMRAVNGVTLITADHGNCEVMIDPVTGKIDKEHSTNPVPLFCIDDERKQEKAQDLVDAFVLAPQPTGILADVAPTIIELMGLKQPKEMTGKSLVEYLV